MLEADCPTSHQPGPLVGLVHQCGPELGLSENVGKEFSVCVISVICHCLPGAVQRTVARTTSRVNEAPGPTDK